MGQCTPAWDGTIGQPGISRGYVQPMANWDDGTGERLYAGGSFAGFIGVPGTTLIAQWDRAAEAWSRVGSPGLSTGSTNGFLTSLLPFEVDGREQLVAAGFFASAGGQPDTQSIAAWDGVSWSSMGGGLVAPNSIWSLIEGDLGDGPRMFAGGAFPTIGGIDAGGLAQWDGERWAAIGLGIGIEGVFSPTVFGVEQFDDGSGPALYAGGRFDSIDAEPGTDLIARFRDGAWEEVGTGLGGSSPTADAGVLAVFDDGNGPALYVGGRSLTAPGEPRTSVYKWDGVSWEAVGQDLGGAVIDLQVWDDGNGPALYLAGTAMPDIGYVARLEGDRWVTVDGGISSQPAVPTSTFASAFGLHVWDGDLYVAGNFTLVGDPAVEVAGIIRRTGCAADCYADFDGDGVLTLFDFLAFQNAFQDGLPETDCDADGSLTLFDFLCFQNAFDAGCE
ncbi:MAG: GC-type dockerin domain-anchored protein [Planctomycetota bacterium]